MKTLQKQQWLWAVLCLLLIGVGGCKKKPDDAALTTSVQAKVSALDAGINVETKDGVVTLAGTVASESTISQAEQAAKEVEGVKSVTNSLTLAAAPEPAPDTAATNDATIKTTVDANLTKYGVTGVTASVANGEITLTGDIKRAKLQDAMKAANEAQPTKVNNQLTIK
ncbi:MAG: BON domain-containing protein [Bacteroidota bacterium]